MIDWALFTSGLCCIFLDDADRSSEITIHTGTISCHHEIIITIMPISSPSPAVYFIATL
jgi:hypothetical protein